MPELMTKNQLADAVKTIASSYDLVQRGMATYIPVHWADGSIDPPPSGTDKIWLPFSREDKMRLANIKASILFSSDSELRNFDFMLRQIAASDNSRPRGVLVKTAAGVRMLNEEGELAPHDGVFNPNYVKPLLNEDVEDTKFVKDTIIEWVGGDIGQAESLLYHLATCLAPHYSAVKYVLLMGEGRNGKGVLLSMLYALFGKENISEISRQAMAEQSSTCVELNDKLLNIIFDGKQDYIKDSSTEKTLIAGEPTVVRVLYESGTTPVQTNALFVEALNNEPKVRDKSPALQKRLVRFQFPNVYEQDKAFFRKMTSERYLGALLNLLIQHYVHEDNIADKLRVTSGSLSLQAEQVFLGSPVLQYLSWLEGENPSAYKKIVSEGKTEVEAFVASYRPWAETQRFDQRSDAGIVEMMKEVFDIKWTTKRIDRKPKSIRVLRALKPDALMSLNQLKGVLDEP